jgi:TonB-dependent SusC/RagA subfamily outer membrane receptor
MSFLPFHQLRLPLVVVGLLATPALVRAGAQLPRGRADSVALLPANRISVANSGAFVAVIDSATIAASGARTLSELLLARVPSLSVRHRGGTEADGSEISSRGMGPVGGAAPLLVIDGIMADAQQALSVPGTSIAVSRLDDLTPAEVQRIEVLRGPAASALYGAGAAAGVIVVTTRRGITGPLRLDVNAGAGLTEMSAQFPANYQLTNGTPQQACNPRVSLSTAADCAPMTLYNWNPLEQASPFRMGHAISGGAALSGTTRGVRVFGGVSAERVNGVTDDDRQSRVGVHGSVERSLPGHVTVSAQGSYLQRDASAPGRGDVFARDNVILRGLLGGAYDDSIGGYFPPDLEPQIIQQAAPSLSRVTSALRVEWTPVGWLSVDALAGQDRSRERALRTTMAGSIGDIVAYQFNRDRWTSGTMHAGVMARYGAPADVALATYVAYDDVRSRNQTIDSTGSGYGNFTIVWGERRTRQQDVTVRQHVAWGSLDVNGGTRFLVGRGISAPFGTLASRNVDASYRLPSPHAGVALRLRAGAGIAPLLPRGSMYLVPTPSAGGSAGGGFGYGFGSYAVRELQSRAGEREGGIDADFGTRARMELTWFRSQARDAVVGTEYMLLGGFSLTGPLLADLSNSGVEAVASAQILHGAHVGWRSTLTASTLRSNVSRVGGRAAYSTNGSATAGYPLQGYWSRSYQWTDANGDGLIATNEVTGGPSSYVGPSRPTLELGMQNAVTLPRGITLTALLDYRHGQYRDNRSEALRCRLYFGGCQGMEDPTLSLDEQARWSAVASYITSDIVPASYLRLRDVVVEWAPASNAMSLRRFAVRVIGQNLLTWTQYDGPDPEVGATSLEASVAPSELFQSPLPRRMRVEVRMGVM